MSVQNPPDGFATATPYLHVRNLEAALAFYQQAFGAELFYALPGPDGKPVHGEIRIGNSIIMLGEESPEMGAKSPLLVGDVSSSIMLYVDDCDAVFQQALAAGATAMTPPADMFWGDRHGKLADPFGHQWGIATHVEEVSPEQVRERFAAMMATM